MPLYNYICLDCKAKAEAIKGSEFTVEELQEVIYETSHRMSPTAKELKESLICPRCLGGNSERTYIGQDLNWWTRGKGFLDRAGCNRDMNLFKLQNDDPYEEHRTVGEVDDLTKRLKDGGKHNPKTRHYTAK